jgi:c-di-GMP-binding flagellar brake protein YcgR
MVNETRSEADSAETDTSASQRREGFRVKPQAGHPGLCHRYTRVGTQQYRIMDVSVVGVSLLLDWNEALPEIGESWPRCHLEVLRDRLIPCDLIVRTVTPGDRSAHRHTRIACSYDAMPDAVERELQRMVFDIQVQRRL